MSVSRWMSLLAVVLVGSMFLGSSQSLALQVGEKAPDFALPATTAEEIKLADYLGKQPVVLFFYIGAFTNT